MYYTKGILCIKSEFHVYSTYIFLLFNMRFFYHQFSLDLTVMTIVCFVWNSVFNNDSVIPCKILLFFKSGVSSTLLIFVHHSKMYFIFEVRNFPLYLLNYIINLRSYRVNITTYLVNLSYRYFFLYKFVLLFRWSGLSLDTLWDFCRFACRKRSRVPCKNSYLVFCYQLFKFY